MNGTMGAISSLFNRLWVRLSLAFVGVILLVVAGVIVTARTLVSDQQVENVLDRQLQAQDGLVERLESYYVRQGSWEGVDSLMDVARSMLLPGTDRGLTLVLLDQDRQLVYPPAEMHTMRNRPVNSGMLSAINPILVDGSTVGYLGFAPNMIAREEVRGNSNGRPPWAGPQVDNGAPDLLREISLFLIRAAAVAGILALLFGIVMSRSLTTPLNNLVTAAQAIGSRELAHRVPVNGTEEMRTVARSFNQMASQLEQAEDLRRNMLADVAHELRTPLTVLQGNLRAMLDGVYQMDEEEIGRLYEQTRHLHRLVDDLHLLAQAEAQQIPLYFQTFALGQLLTETMELFAPLAEEKSVQLSVQLYRQIEDAPLNLRADRARLGQVLQNLVSNALRHTPSGGQVTLTAEQQKDEIFVAVADTGEGIAPENLPHVFERFYRADKSRSRDLSNPSSGTGLGLAIVQALVTAHGGRVWAESPGLGQGTTINLLLPVSFGVDDLPV